jgi:hypothetical protein
LEEVVEAVLLVVVLVDFYQELLLYQPLQRTQLQLVAAGLEIQHQAILQPMEQIALDYRLLLLAVDMEVRKIQIMDQVVLAVAVGLAVLLLKLALLELQAKVLPEVLVPKMVVVVVVVQPLLVEMEAVA